MLNLGFARDHTYAVMGLGKSGAVAARALAAAGATVLAWDDSDDRRAALQGVDGITVVDPVANRFAGVDALVLSPGIPHTHPQPHPAAAAAKTAGVPIIGTSSCCCAPCPTAGWWRSPAPTASPRPRR